VKAFIFVVLAGCMPYALPPVNGNVGATRTTENGARTGLHAELGVAPMQLVDGQLRRRWDATLSGSYDRMGTHDAWGVAVVGGPIVYPFGVDRHTADRLLPQLVGRWTTETMSAGVRLTAERALFARGSGDSSVAFGEGAIGFYVEADYQRDGEYFVHAGLAMRIPAIAGVACCIH
jgi:hypothetical protein